MRVLVTGATGTLGRPTVQALRASGATVRVLSRQVAAPQGDDEWCGVEWARGEFTTGAGVDDALRGVDVVVHAAHDRDSAERDVAGVRLLLEAAERARVARVVYVSIVGARHVPGVAYYAGKKGGEEVALASRIGAVFRATQFHDFVDELLHRSDRLPRALVLPKGVRAQPVDVVDCAVALARYALAPAPPTHDFAGPEVLDVRALAEQWLAARGERKRVFEVPAPGPALRAIAAGALTSDVAERGRTTWRTWLARTYSSAPGR